MTSSKKFKKRLTRSLKAGALGVLAVTLLYFMVRACSGEGALLLPGDSGEVVDPGSMYSISLADYAPTRYIVKEGQAFGSVMDEIGVPYSTISDLLNRSKDVFNPRRWRAGDAYWVFRSADSAAAAHYFIYESSKPNTWFLD